MSKAQTTPLPENVTRIQRTWIFQANPNLYDIQKALQVEKEEMWNLRQHRHNVHTGDRIFIWISGTRAGIYARGTVITEPVITSDSVKGIGYWTDKRRGYRPIARVWVRYDQVFLDRPLLRDFLLCDPALWNMTIIRSPRGTNFSVTDEEWHAIESWFEGE